MAAQRVDPKVLPKEVRKRHKAITLAFSHGDALLTVQCGSWYVWQRLKKGWVVVRENVEVIPARLMSPMPIAALTTATNRDKL